MPDSHPINQSCIDRFNDVARRDSELDSRMAGTESSIAIIKQEVIKLTGNGTRGKIDELGSQIADLRESNALRAGRQEAQITTLENSTALMGLNLSSFEDKIHDTIDKLDKRLWSVAVKVFGAVAVLEVCIILGAYYITR